MEPWTACSCAQHLGPALPLNLSPSPTPSTPPIHPPHPLPHHRITEHLDHRIVDVSSVSELCKRWFPREFRNRPRKGNKHTALVDIKESVHELRYYKQHVFKKK